MTYTQTIDFLFSCLPAFHRIGKAAYKDNLDNTLALDEYLGHPQLKFKTIHVGGTNGKGSVSHMLSSVLQEAGYKTGLYTSPHLKDFRERIRINGKMITEEYVVSFVSAHRKIIDSLHPSFFEITVAMAFDYFAVEKVDVAVIEVGLGGRLDSTNIINPVLSVITNIGHDHMDLLGDSLEKIAGEKAGIIKKGVPVVIGETQEWSELIFRSKALECGSQIVFADRHFTCKLSEDAGLSGERSYIVNNLTAGREIKGVTPLGGDYQEKNLRTLFCSCELLGKHFNLDDGVITTGISGTVSATGLLGRWQVLGRNPLIICDTGHNREGLEYVMRQLGRIQSEQKHIILGFVKDKDTDLVLPLFPRDARYYFTKASIQRAMDETLLMENAREYGLKGASFSTVKEALAAAKREASPGDLIFIGGSTFVVAEIV